MRRAVLLFMMSVIAAPHVLRADDWPQWLGPRRDSVWREEGVVEQFPRQGLKILWRQPVALGYAGPAVANGKVYVMDYAKQSGDIVNSPGTRNELEGQERVWCLDAATGEPLWSHEYPCPYNVSYAGGPRCTPVVVSGHVYTLGTEGDLLCLDARTGRVVWSKKLAEHYETETPIWGFAAHPLVSGERLYCVVGGPGSVAVAFNRRTGEEVWRALSAPEPGYCPPTMIDSGGRKQLLIWTPISLNALDPANGDILWTVPLKPNYGMSVTAPRKLDDLLYASGIGNTAALLRLDRGGPGADVVWRAQAKDAVFCCNSTPYLEDGMIFGCDCQLGALIGVDMKDGSRLWETFEPTTGGSRRAGHGTAFIVRHKNGFFLFSETGDLIRARMSRDGYEELDRFHVLEPTNDAFGRPVVWSHPAFARRCLFARNDQEVVCVDLSKSQ